MSDGPRLRFPGVEAADPAALKESRYRAISYTWWQLLMARMTGPWQSALRYEVLLDRLLNPPEVPGCR